VRGNGDGIHMGNCVGVHRGKYAWIYGETVQEYIVETVRVIHRGNCARVPGWIYLGNDYPLPQILGKHNYPLEKQAIY